MRVGSLSALSASIVGTTLAIMPLSLLGAASVEIRQEISFSTTALGQLVAVYFFSLAAFSVPMGKFVERIGHRSGLLLGAIGSAGALLGIAVLASTWWHLALCFVLAGMSSAIVQPSANTAIVRVSAPHRVGLTFGIKQSAVPFAGVVAGTMVPLVVLTIGWRWAFALSAIGAALVVVLVMGLRVGAVNARTDRDVQRDAPNRYLFALAAAFALGTAAAGSLTVFFVESSVAAGVSLSSAGAILSVASGAGVATRLFVGWLADRGNRSQLPRIGAMLCLGALGFFAIASGFKEIFLVGAFLGFAAGWGWPGLMNLTVVQMWSRRPATSTGVAMTGMAFGATVGPIVLGKIADDLSFATMWTVVGCLALGAAVMVIWIGRQASAAGGR